MSTAPHPRSQARVAPVPVPGWGWLLLALAVTVLYLVVHDNGAVLASAAADMTHDLFHDARHGLGVPCH